MLLCAILRRFSFSIAMVARRWDDQRLIEVAKVFQDAMNIGQKLNLQVEPTVEVKVQIPIPIAKDLPN